MDREELKRKIEELRNLEDITREDVVESVRETREEN